MPYLFTSESVSEGHPDKVADQISDALIDNFLAHDPESKVACETLVTTGQVFLAGEVKSKAYLDVQKIARDVIKKLVTQKASTCLIAIHAAYCQQFMSNRLILTRVLSALPQKSKVPVTKV